MARETENLLPYLREATIELSELRSKLRNIEVRETEPIAIVSIGCRYPGNVRSADDLWRLVADEGDAITSFPDNRGWDLDFLTSSNAAGEVPSYTSQGGFITDVDQFDPQFFGISPREAVAMDPQQRVFLEICWEALEHSHLDRGDLKGTSTGVFVGVMHSGYGHRISSVSAADFSGYLGTGAAASVLSGRVSYIFGLEGPAISVDTACSSSLVAIHLAVQSLRRGECSMALAGGVSVLATPDVFVEFCRQQAVSPDGRCKSFAKAADGTSFADGAGVLLLERLSDAERSGHPVMALIRGSAANQDGASNGLTAPSGVAQEAVIRAALADAGVPPTEVDAVEAHGTGTVLGDPIEAQALIGAYGAKREEPLRIGSLKSNLGHTQAAAGVGGVIKMAMSMRRGLLPRSLHIDSPTPHVDWDDSAVELLTEPFTWEPADGKPRRAGVSSFGVSGTNAHLVLEEAPVDTGAAVLPSVQLGSDEGDLFGEETAFVLSAKDPQALRERAEQLVSLLESSPDADLHSVAASLVHKRPNFDHRLVIIGDDRELFLSDLRAVAGETDSPRLIRGSAPIARRIAFVFPGQGSQWSGMARHLLESSPPFASSMHKCQDALSAHIDWSIEDVLRGAPGAPDLDRLEVLQPVLFGVMVSLADLWRMAGVEPDAVVGHSQGEIVAAHIAGALSLEDSARIVALRSDLIARLAGTGAMVSVQLPANRAEQIAEAFNGRVQIAVLNGPRSIAVASDEDSIDAFAEACAREGAAFRRIASTIPSHSSYVESLQGELVERLEAIRPSASQIPIYSATTGAPIEGSELGAGYWYRNLREPVDFEAATRALMEDGIDAFLEVSAHPVLIPAIEEIADSSESDPVVVRTLQRSEPEGSRLLRSMAEAYVAGVPVDWQVLLHRAHLEPVELPSYPFRRQRFWLDGEAAPSSPARIGQTATDHPFLPAKISIGDRSRQVLTGSISVHSESWLTDHRIFDTSLLPGTAFVDFALRACSDIGHAHLEELTLEAPLILDDDEVAVQVVIGEDDQTDRRSIEIYCRSSKGSDEEAWTRHASGTITASEESPAFEPVAWPPASGEPIDLSDFYDDAAALGFDYGPSFQLLRRAWRDGDSFFAEISLDEPQLREADRYEIHPALFDAALHTVLLAGRSRAELPFSWRDVRLFRRGSTGLRIRINPGAGGPILEATDTDGQPVLTVGALAGRPVELNQLKALKAKDSLLLLDWIQTSVGSESGPSVPWLPLDWNADRSSWRQALGALAEERPEGDGTEPRVVAVQVPLGPGGDHPAEATTTKSRILEVVQLLQEWLVSPLEDWCLLVITESGVTIGDDDPLDIGMSAITGLVRSAVAEHPERFALLDADDVAGIPTVSISSAMAEGDLQLAWRHGNLYVPRLVRASSALLTPDESAGGASRPLDELEGTVLITGGTGALGAVIARHFAEQATGASLLILSRSGGGTAQAIRLSEELEQLGAEVHIQQCDVSDRAQLADVLSSIPPERPLRSVVHAAGVLGDALISGLTPEQVDRAWESKAAAAWYLHELTEETDLDSFVMLSSLAALVGAAGQAGYTAANAFLDGLAQHRQASGLVASSLAPPLRIAGSSMLQHLSEAQLKRVERYGAIDVPDKELGTLFQLAVESGEPYLALAAFDLNGLRAALGTGILPPVLSRLTGGSTKRGAGRGDLARQLSGQPESSWKLVVMKLVRSEMAAVLGYPSGEAISPARQFKELGIDSLGAVEFRNRLTTATGLRFPATLVFDHPTPEAVTEYVLERLANSRPSPLSTIVAEFDKLEASLADTSLSDGDERIALARARTLVKTFSVKSAGLDVEDTDRLRLASADELIHLLDNNLDWSPERQ